MWICAIVVEGKNGGLYPDTDNSWRAIPLHIYKIMMGGNEHHFEIPSILLSALSLCDEDIFAGDELLKVKEEINELIEKQLVTQGDMQEILKVLQFGIDNHRRVMFTPFWIDDTPSEEI